MAAIISKVQICNLSQGHLGNRNSVNNIDTPKTDKEIVYALWYDIVRQNHLKSEMPNFALDRIIVSQKTPPAFGYKYAYEYPSNCLKLLGIGNIDLKGDVKYTIEGNLILTDELYTDGMPIRFIRDVTTVAEMSPEFIMSFSVALAERVALSITQDQGKKAAMQKQQPLENANTSGLNAQENPPIRRSVSRIQSSRLFNGSDNPTKK